MTTATTRHKGWLAASTVAIILAGAAAASTGTASAAIGGGGGGGPSMNCSTTTHVNAFGQLAVGRCTNPGGGIGGFTLHAKCAGTGPYDSPTIFVDPGQTAVTNIQCWASWVSDMWITQP